MQGQPRLVEAVADVMIELGVLLGRDLGARTGPQGRGAVDRLLLVALGENDRQRDVIGIALDDLA